MRKKTPLTILAVAAIVSCGLNLPCFHGAGLQSVWAGETQSTASENCKQLVSQILKAYGGPAVLHELELMPVRATMKLREHSTISEAENEFDCQIVSKGNKQRVETSVMGQKLITAFDGKTAWLQQGEDVSPADSKVLKHMQEDVEHSLDRILLSLLEPETHCISIPEKTVGGKRCVGLLVKPVHKGPSTIYVEPDSHLVVRVEYTGVDAEQGVKAEVACEYSDYRPTMGSQEPFRVVDYANGKKISEQVQVAICKDQSVDDSYFQMPSEVEIPALKNGSVTVSFDYEYNEVIVTARLNDKRDCRFILDTGASQSMLDMNVARELGSLDNSTYSVSTGSGSMKMSYLVVSKLQLGALVLNNISIGATESSALNTRGNKTDGILGANVLKRFLLTIDYPKHKLVINDPRHIEIPAGATVVQTQPALGAQGMIVHGVLDGKVDVPLLVDTGAAFNNISASLIKPILQEELLPVGTVMGLDGQRVNVGAVKLHSLKIGDLTVANPVFSVSNDNAGAKGGIITSRTLAILGNPFWHRFKVTVDYRNNRLFLQQSKENLAIQNAAETVLQVRKQFLKTHDYAAAISQLTALCKSANEAGNKAAEAIYRTNLAAIQGDRVTLSDAADVVRRAYEQFDYAIREAKQSGSRMVEAHALARKALFIEQTNPGAEFEIHELLRTAAAVCPFESTVAVAAAKQLSRRKPEQAQVIVDQVLSVEPDNWDALWLRYKVSNKKAEQLLVAAQLNRYFAGIPEVDRLSMSGRAKPDAHIHPGVKRKAIKKVPKGHK